MSKGFLWFCQNTDKVDYVKCSIELAKSIKKYNKENKICVVTDKKFESEYIDVVTVMDTDDSIEHKIKWANEYKAFALSPFTHTIKLEADMLWAQNTDWWWYYLWQHDLVFSVDCKNYKDETVKNITYRKLFVRNNLPNIYNGLMYFRRSIYAQNFYKLCGVIVQNWKQVRDTVLIGCHDPYPSTDVVYALAYRVIDPTQKQLIDYPWFKFIHNKPAVQGQDVADLNSYLMPMKIGNKILVGSQRLSRVWHYVDKTMPEELNARVF